MALKNAFVAAICTGFLALAVPALADEYRPSEFLSLDLPKAVLSPKRLGPEAQFEPVPIEAKADRAAAEPAARTKVAGRKTLVARVPVPTRGAARMKLARRHGNPLDAQARDTRIQTWPCKSGGICGWQRN